ncbi:MAG: hypothetical protein HOV87_03440 [Catenulispora sp.]|nr:hypothetical protein [Catenulispora sp.]
MSASARLLICAQAWHWIEPEIAWTKAREIVEPGGTLALWWNPVEPVKAFQRDTAVLRDHRGHGLGRAMKAAMMRGLVADRPDVASVATQTGDVVNMARINNELGYRTLAEYYVLDAEVAELEKYVGRS